MDNLKGMGMKKFTLEDIKAAAEKLYGGTVINEGTDDEFTLRNLLRLSPEERIEYGQNAADGASERAADPNEAATANGVIEMVRKQLLLISTDPAKCQKILDFLDDAETLMLFSLATGSDEEQGEA